MRQARDRGRRGFTLVEIMFVVLLLGILAAALISMFGGLTGDARQTAVMRQLQVVRDALQVYKTDHNDVYPDLIGDQWTQVTQTTDVDGTLDAAGTLGPYATTVPANPLNGNTAVDTTASGPTIGWVYTAATGTIQATNQTPTLIFNETTQVVQ